MTTEILDINTEIEKEIQEELNSGYVKSSHKLMTREEVLSKLSDAVAVIYNKAVNGRIRKDTDKERLLWLKAQGYLAGVYLAGLKDIQYEKLSERVDKIEIERDRLVFETQRQKEHIEELKDQIERPNLEYLKKTSKMNSDVILNTIR